MTRTRLVYLVARVELYHPARLSALHSELSESFGELHVLELTRRCLAHPVEVDRESWAFPCTTLLDELDGPGTARKVGVRSILDRLEPEVLLVTGYDRPEMRAAARWAQRRGAICILAADTHELDRPRHYLKERLKAFWIRRHFDAAFVAGARSFEYYRRLGLPASRIWRGYSVVDNRFFAQAADAIRRRADTHRAMLGLPQRFFLYVGRLALEKNVDRLLEAYGRYRDAHGASAWGLVIVGSGPEERRLRAWATSRGLTEVIWAGYRQPADLPAYYSLASALVLPSLSEPWGLVINEAMACGLPILASDRCGAAVDLVLPGINGHVFDPNDPEELARHLYRMADGDVDLARMGKASAAMILERTPDNWAIALCDCVRTVHKLPHRRNR